MLLTAWLRVAENYNIYFLESRCNESAIKLSRQGQKYQRTSQQHVNRWLMSSACRTGSRMLQRRSSFWKRWLKKDQDELIRDRNANANRRHITDMQRKRNFDFANASVIRQELNFSHRAHPVSPRPTRLYSNDQTSPALVLLLVLSSLKLHRHRPLLFLHLLLSSPWEGNLEDKRIKVSLPLHGLSWKNLHFEDSRDKKSGKKVGACRRAIRCDNVVAVLETDVCERTCLSAGNKILLGAPRRFDGFARSSLPRKLDARFCVSRARSVSGTATHWCKTEPCISSISAFSPLNHLSDDCYELYTCPHNICAGHKNVTL